MAYTHTRLRDAHTRTLWRRVFLSGDRTLSHHSRDATRRSADGANIHSSVVKVKRQRAKHVHFYTSRRIAAGEELVWNYGKLFWQNEAHKIL